MIAFNLCLFESFQFYSNTIHIEHSDQTYKNTDATKNANNEFRFLI